MKSAKNLAVSYFRLKVSLVCNLPYHSCGLREIMAILLERQSAYSDPKA